MGYKKKCLWCGKYYVAHTVESRYCSKRCVNFAWKTRTRKKEINQKLELRQEVDYHNATADLKCAEFLTLQRYNRLMKPFFVAVRNLLKNTKTFCMIRQNKGKTRIFVLKLQKYEKDYIGISHVVIRSRFSTGYRGFRYEADADLSEVTAS